MYIYFGSYNYHEGECKEDVANFTKVVERELVSDNVLRRYELRNKMKYMVEDHFVKSLRNWKTYNALFADFVMYESEALFRAVYGAISCRNITTYIQALCNLQTHWKLVWQDVSSQSQMDVSLVQRSELSQAIQDAIRFRDHLYNPLNELCHKMGFDLFSPLTLCDVKAYAHSPAFRMMKSSGSERTDQCAWCGTLDDANTDAVSHGRVFVFQSINDPESRIATIWLSNQSSFYGPDQLAFLVTKPEIVRKLRTDQIVCDMCLSSGFGFIQG